MRFWLVVLATLGLSTPSIADACIHAAGDAEVEESAYNAIVMYADELQRIYLRPGVDLDSGSVDIAWVIPTPNRPRNVALANLAFVEWVESELAIQQLVQPRAKRGTSEPLEVSEPFKVGPYEMQTVEATGREGATALATWLDQNGFGKIEGPILDYYVENAWSFTTVKSNLTAGTGDDDQELLPIMIEFATPTPVVPTRLMAAKNKILLKAWYIADHELKEDFFRHANRAFGLEIAPDRRKGSDWSVASDEWILGRESVYTSQLTSRNAVLDEIKQVYPEANRLWVYALVGEVSPRRASRAREDLFIGPPKTSLDMSDYVYEPPEAAPMPEKAKAPDAGTPDAGTPDPTSPTPDFVQEIDDETEWDMTMIMGVVALVFFVLVVLGVQFRRMR